MRKALVLNNEGARHPFRQRTLLLEDVHPVESAPKPGLSDAGFFWLTFVSGFIVIFGLIA